MVERGEGRGCGRGCEGGCGRVEENVGGGGWKRLWERLVEEVIKVMVVSGWKRK